MTVVVSRVVYRSLTLEQVGWYEKSWVEVEVEAGMQVLRHNGKPGGAGGCCVYSTRCWLFSLSHHIGVVNAPCSTMIPFFFFFFFTVSLARRVMFCAIGLYRPICV